MKECCICYLNKRDNLFINKTCCVYDICLSCYKELKVKTCPICKTDTICKEVNITSKEYIMDILKIKLPRCGCITKLYGTPCRNKIYPPFNTCIIHHNKKDTDYYDICNKILRYIIFNIYQIPNNYENLSIFYYLYEKYNCDLNIKENYDNFYNYINKELYYKNLSMNQLLKDNNIETLSKIINFNRVFKIKN